MNNIHTNNTFADNILFFPNTPTINNISTYTPMNIINNNSNNIYNNNNINNTLTPSDPHPAGSCLILADGGEVPWDNAHSLISSHTEDMVHRIKYTLVLPLLFLIGGPGNVINMAVFYRQGLKERINVCLFALSLVDFLYLFFNFVFYVEQAYLQLVTGFAIKEKYGPLMRFLINHHLLSFFGLPWVSQIISAIIAGERCFCVLWPLHSQNVLSPSTTTLLITLSALITLSLHFLAMTVYQAVCAYDPVTNSTIWTLTPSQFFLEHQQFIGTLNAYVFGVGIPGVVITMVTVTTSLTIFKLYQAAAWRARVSSGSASAAGVSSSGGGGSTEREVGVTVMLVYNSIFFVICVFPSALYRTVYLYVPELGIGQQQHNLSMLCNWILDTLSYVNATFNILIYYSMGSRYRHTFWRLLAPCRRGTPSQGRKAALADVGRKPAGHGSGGVYSGVKKHAGHSSGGAPGGVGKQA